MTAQQIQINKENKTIAITTSDNAVALADTAVITIGFHVFSVRIKTVRIPMRRGLPLQLWLH